MVSTNLKFEKANLSKDTKIITFDFNAQRTGKRYKLRLSNPNKCSYGCKIDWFIENDCAKDEYYLHPTFNNGMLAYCYVADSYSLKYNTPNSIDEYLQQIAFLIGLRLSKFICMGLNMADDYNVGNIDEFHIDCERISNQLNRITSVLFNGIDSTNIASKLNKIIDSLNTIQF